MQAGVKDIVLAVNYRPEVMVSVLKKTEEEYGITINFSVETEPLGTAGPLALAREILGKDDSPFFVLNSDVTCTYPFEAFRDFHIAHGGEGSIMVTKVAEPSAYGVVVTKPNSTVIDRFVEKPVEFVGNRINAGIYIFNPSVLDRIELKPTSIEQEVFPAMAADHQLHSFDLAGFWMDIGQPKDYLTGTCLYLSHLTATHSPLLTDPAKNKWVYGGNVLVDPTAEIHPTAVLGPNVVIGPGVKIGAGVRLQRCVVLSNAVVREHAWIASSIIGWNSNVGRWTRVENITVLGDDVTIKDELYVNGASVLPHKSVCVEPKTIMPGTLLMNPRSRRASPSLESSCSFLSQSAGETEDLHPLISLSEMRYDWLADDVLLPSEYPTMASYAQITSIPTPTLFKKDASITTLSVTEAASTSSASSSSSTTPVPIGAIVGGLVGGIAAGLLVAGLWWWCVRKRNRERDVGSALRCAGDGMADDPDQQARHKAAVARRNRKRLASNATSRPSISSTRGEVAGGGMGEKEHVPPVPVLPAQAYDPHENRRGEEKAIPAGYGYASTPSSERHARSPTSPTSPTSADANSYTPLVAEPKPSSKPSKSSRSTARIAAAEQAAEAVSLDPIARYQPKKPSPLAAAKYAERREQPGYQEMLAPPIQDETNGRGGRQVDVKSGEWGVALGSPVGDGNFDFHQQQQQQQQQSQPQYNYDNDPYLQNRHSNGDNRYSQGGAYTYDPYEEYHQDEEVDYHAAATSMGLEGKKGGGSWV